MIYIFFHKIMLPKIKYQNIIYEIFLLVLILISKAQAHFEFNFIKEIKIFDLIILYFIVIYALLIFFFKFLKQKNFNKR